MRRLEFAPEAETDLLTIADYIARDNPERARSFIDELESRCVRLLDFPDAGTLRSELAPGLRSTPHGRYVIFYTPGTNVVRIERILHGSRDIGVEFGSVG